VERRGWPCHYSCRLFRRQKKCSWHSHIIIFPDLVAWSWDSSVSGVTRLWTSWQKDRVSITAGFSYFPKDPVLCGVHQASCAMDRELLALRPRKVPPTIDEFKNEWRYSSTSSLCFHGVVLN
jgi:hypothetical protein